MGDPAKAHETLLVQLTVGELKGVIRDAVRDELKQITAPYLDTEAVATYFQVDARTIRNWIARGAPANQIGRDYRIKLAEFDAWVSEHGPKKLQRVK